MSREMLASDTAVLVIDVQLGILSPARSPREQQVAKALDETIVRIARLTDRARAAAVPVIYIQHDGGSGHRLEPGTPGWPIRPEIAPQPGEKVIRKRASDSFFETTLGAELAAAGIQRLVVCGCMTQYCVDTTVRRAVSLGYDVVLAADGHSTADTAAIPFETIISHHNALLDGFDAGAHEVRVCPSSEIRFPGSPEVR